jgi:hypothetical protein
LPIDTQREIPYTPALKKGLLAINSTSTGYLGLNPCQKWDLTLAPSSMSVKDLVNNDQLAKSPKVAIAVSLNQQRTI